jgi:hypothetical protein
MSKEKYFLIEAKKMYVPEYSFFVVYEGDRVIGNIDPSFGKLRFRPLWGNGGYSPFNIANDMNFCFPRDVLGEAHRNNFFECADYTIALLNEENLTKERFLIEL